MAFLQDIDILDMIVEMKIVENGLVFNEWMNWYDCSSANAKKWEVELATLKNNNARLTNALQESTANVEEWKRQLQAYKDENTRVKTKIVELESSSGGGGGRGALGSAEQGNSSELKREVAGMRIKIESLEAELRAKDDEIRRLANEIREMNLNCDKLKVMSLFIHFQLRLVKMRLIKSERWVFLDRFQMN